MPGHCARVERRSRASSSVCRKRPPGVGAPVVTRGRAEGVACALAAVSARLIALCFSATVLHLCRDCICTRCMAVRAPRLVSLSKGGAEGEVLKSPGCRGYVRRIVRAMDDDVHIPLVCLERQCGQ